MPCTRSTRPGWWEITCLWGPHPPHGRSGPPAVEMWQWNVVTPIWHTRSTSPISMPSSREAVAINARSCPPFQSPLRVQTVLASQTAVVRGDRIFPQSLRQVSRQPLRQPPGVDKDQRSAVLFDELRQLLVNFGPGFSGQDRFHRRPGQRQCQIAAYGRGRCQRFLYLPSRCRSENWPSP